MGIEPTLSAWEAEVLPLNYARMTDILAAKFSGARHWSRQVGHPSRVCLAIVASECAQAGWKYQHINRLNFNHVYAPKYRFRSARPGSLALASLTLG